MSKKKFICIIIINIIMILIMGINNSYAAESITYNSSRAYSPWSTSKFTGDLSDGYDSGVYCREHEQHGPDKGEVYKLDKEKDLSEVTAYLFCKYTSMTDRANLIWYLNKTRTAEINKNNLSSSKSKYNVFANGNQVDDEAGAKKYLEQAAKEYINKTKNRPKEAVVTLEESSGFAKPETKDDTVSKTITKKVIYQLDGTKTDSDASGTKKFYKYGKFKVNSNLGKIVIKAYVDKVSDDNLIDIYRVVTIDEESEFAKCFVKENGKNNPGIVIGDGKEITLYVNAEDPQVEEANKIIFRIVSKDKNVERLGRISKILSTYWNKRNTRNCKNKS